MKKRLALTKDGKLTYCTSSEENIGKGRCNHVDHQKNDESQEDFCKRITDMKNDEKKIHNLKDEDRIKLIKSKDINDQYLDILVHDEDLDVRPSVADYGRDKDLDVLLNDKDWHVRASVAKCGRDKDLNILVNDRNYDVRVAVAEYNRNKNLDILANYEEDI